MGGGSGGGGGNARLFHAVYVSATASKSKNGYTSRPTQHRTDVYFLCMCRAKNILSPSSVAITDVDLQRETQIQLVSSG